MDGTNSIREVEGVVSFNKFRGLRGKPPPNDLAGDARSPGGRKVMGNFDQSYGLAFAGKRNFAAVASACRARGTVFHALLPIATKKASWHSWERTLSLGFFV